MKTLAWALALIIGLAWSAAAAENAPQVLTSDLALKQRIETSTLTVNFVIVDEDKVTKVTIDGEEQKIIPGDTVLITKKFVFTKGRRIIRLVVEDEAGNKRERSYLVAYGVPIEPAADEKKEAKLKFGFAFDVRYEVDDNPTQDLSLPVSVSDIGDLEGVIDDSEQEDNRTVLKGLVTASRGKLSGFLGLIDTTYDKAINKQLNSQVLFLGGGVKFGGGNQYLLGGVFSDVNLGGNDYANQFTVSPGYESRGSDEDGTNKTLYGLDLTSKSFADSARENGVEATLKRVYSSLDKEKLDRYRSLIAIGTRTEGTPGSEFSYFRSDFDWANKWNSGFKWDIGLGYQYRNYPNDKDILSDEVPPDFLFGDNRVDNLMHFSTGVGVEFWKLTAMLNYRYTFDYSNDSPYVRQIYGLSLRGTF